MKSDLITLTFHIIPISLFLRGKIDFLDSPKTLKIRHIDTPKSSNQNLPKYFVLRYFGFPKYQSTPVLVKNSKKNCVWIGSLRGLRLS